MALASAAPLGCSRSWGDPSELPWLEQRDQALALPRECSVRQLPRAGGDSWGGGLKGRPSVSVEVGWRIWSVHRKMDGLASHPISIWSRYHFVCEVSHEIRLTSAFELEHETPIWLLFMDETSCFLFFALSLFTLFTSFLYNYVTICMVLSPQSLRWLLDSIFCSCLEVTYKACSRGNKKICHCISGIHGTFSKGLLQRRKLRNVCLSESQMHDPFATRVLVRKAPETGFWILAALHHGLLVAPASLDNWSLPGMSGELAWQEGVEISHSQLWGFQEEENRVQRTVPVVCSVDDVYWVMDEHGTRSGAGWSGWNGRAGERRVNQSWDLLHQLAGFISPQPCATGS